MADTNIYISDLPAGMDEDTLKALFGAYGTVTWGKVFQGKGKPGSSGIIEFASIEEAKWVVENVSGNIPEGLSTPVTITFKKAKAAGGGGKGFGKDGGKAALLSALMGQFGGGNRSSPYGGGGKGGKGGAQGQSFDAETEQMLDQWVQAKRSRDFATADSLRTVLRAQGVDPDTVR
jgi:RNA recognition motif-containing protein